MPSDQLFQLDSLVNKDSGHIIRGAYLATSHVSRSERKRTHSRSSASSKGRSASKYMESGEAPPSSVSAPSEKLPGMASQCALTSAAVALDATRSTAAESEVRSTDTRRGAAMASVASRSGESQ
eukprot:scaffold894_cov130-Isochrysis_galbana.AAC.6